MTHQAASAVVVASEKTVNGMIELEARYKLAAEFLDKATDSISESWAVWIKESAEYLNNLRLWRMAVETEVKSGTTALKDISQFLGSEETKQQLKTLKDLVEVGERLKMLKDSGFLDSMTDIMLKVKP